MLPARVFEMWHGCERLLWQQWWHRAWIVLTVSFGNALFNTRDLLHENDIWITCCNMWIYVLFKWVLKHLTGVSSNVAGHQMVPLCPKWWCSEANEATETHCDNPGTPTYPIWAYCMHGWQRGCQEDFVSLPAGGLEKTTRTPLHHMAKHHPARSEMSSPHTPWSSQHGSESSSVEVAVDFRLPA